MYKLGTNIVSNKSSGQYRKSIPLDPDAQLVIDRMTGLSSIEINAINNFVIAEKDDGNYSLYDEFYALQLGATNGLIGFKSKTATAFGGVTWDVNGVKGNGTTGYIATDFIPSVDSTQRVLNNAISGGFVTVAGVGTVSQYLFGSFNSNSQSDRIFTNTSNIKKWIKQ